MYCLNIVSSTYYVSKHRSYPFLESSQSRTFFSVWFCYIPYANQIEQPLKFVVVRLYTLTAVQSVLLLLLLFLYFYLHTHITNLTNVAEHTNVAEITNVALLY